MIEYTEVQLYEELLTEYDEIIEFNKETNIRNTPLITITILLVMTAVTFLSLGVLYMLWSPRYVFYLFWLVVGLLAVAGWRSGLISQLKQRVELWAQE
jgi:fatty acid desaturase